MLKIPNTKYKFFFIVLSALRRSPGWKRLIVCIGHTPSCCTGGKKPRPCSIRAYPCASAAGTPFAIASQQHGYVVRFAQRAVYVLKSMLRASLVAHGSLRSLGIAAQREQRHHVAWAAKNPAHATSWLVRVRVLQGCPPCSRYAAAGQQCADAQGLGATLSRLASLRLGIAAQ